MRLAPPVFTQWTNVSVINLIVQKSYQVSSPKDPWKMEKNEPLT